jgi:hypothetical protein
MAKPQCNETKPEIYSKTKQEIYSKPTLTDYGTIHELTKSLGMDGSRDGGSPPADKTAV